MNKQINTARQGAKESIQYCCLMRMRFMQVIMFTRTEQATFNHCVPWPFSFFKKNLFKFDLLFHLHVTQVLELLDRIMQHPTSMFSPSIEKNPKFPLLSFTTTYIFTAQFNSR